MKKVMICFLTAFLLSLSVASACIELGADYATQVLLSKQGITYDIDKIKEATSDKMIYPSHYNSEVGIIISENTRNLLKQEWIDDELNSSTEENISGLDITVQIPFEVSDDLITTSLLGVNPDDFNFNEAMKTELKWLKDSGMLNIEDSDIDAISLVSNKGKAGPNSEIVYYGGKWQPYGDIEGALLLESFGCGNTELVDELLSVLEKTDGDAGTNDDTNGTAKTADATLIYIVAAAIAIVMIVIAFFILRKGKAQPQPEQANQ